MEHATRRELEELMISLQFHIYTDEDIKRIILLKKANETDKFFFKLTSQKDYFEKIIIPFCDNAKSKIANRIIEPKIKNDFVKQFNVKEEEKLVTTSLIACCTRCTKCNDIPLLYLSNREYKVNIHCEQCNFNEYLDISDYTKLTENLSIKNGKCEEHKNDLISMFCLECKKHLCINCNKNEHNNHQIVDLTNKIQLKELTKQYHKVKKHLDNYCINLKNRIISKLKNEKKQVFDAYNSFYANNSNILLLIKEIMDDYSSFSNNYYLRENLLNLREFNIDKCRDEFTSSGIIDYFQNYKILGEKGFYRFGPSVRYLKPRYLLGKDEQRKIKKINNYRQKHQMVKVVPTKLFASFYYDIVVIWSSYNCEYKVVINPHDLLINKILFPSNKSFLTYSKDKAIKIWENNKKSNNILSRKTKLTLIHLIKLNRKKILIACSSDKNLYKWNLCTSYCEGILSNIDYYEKTQICEIKDKLCINGIVYITIVNSNIFTKEIIIINAVQNFDLIKIISLKEKEILWFFYYLYCFLTYHHQ